MKRIFLLILVATLLVSCQKMEKTNEEEIKPTETNTENTNDEKEGKIKSGKIILESGQEINYSDINVRLSSLDEKFYPIEITSYAKREIINILAGLQYLDSKDIYESAYDEKSIIIDLGDNSYIEMIENAANSNGDFIYNYYKNKRLESIVASKNNLRSEIMAAIIEGQTLENEEKEKYLKSSQVKIANVNLIDKFYEDEKLIMLYQLGLHEYDFENGIFTEVGGKEFPMEIRYILKDGKYIYSENIYPKDGSMFADSIEQMSRGLDYRKEKLLENSGSFYDSYDKLMDKLSRKAKELGLENYSHKLSEVPGYEKNVIYLEYGPNIPQNTLALVKESDYEAAKAQVGKDNWPHAEGLLYHKPTGIVVTTIVDSFE